jgi:hypothetical protein
MALKHDFNRLNEDADPIEQIDATFTSLADRCGEQWRTRTPFSRQSLTLGLYIVASICGLGYVLLTHKVLFLGIIVLAYLGSLPGRQRGSLIEEMQLEVSGLPRNTLKYLAVLLLTLGLFGVVTSLPTIFIGTATGNLSYIDLPSLIGGLALVLLKVADYITRTNPSNRNGDPEKAIERLQSRQAAPMAA